MHTGLGFAKLHVWLLILGLLSVCFLKEFPLVLACQSRRDSAWVLPQAEVYVGSCRAAPGSRDGWACSWSARVPSAAFPLYPS